MRLFLGNEPFSRNLIDVEHGSDCAEVSSRETGEGILLSVPQNLVSAGGRDLSELTARVLLQVCESRGLRLSLAESCTGGAMASQLTAIPGSSRVFDFSAVTYSNAMKQQILGVNSEILEKHGAVSSQTVENMYRGLLSINPGAAACAVSGIAGPGGGSEEKPVGLVYIAAGLKNQDPDIRRWLFHGDRAMIRRKAVESANIQMIHRLLNC